jgi:hypothetical protein
MKYSICAWVFAGLSSLSTSAAALNIPPPMYSVTFGSSVRFLPNGNFVVVDSSAGPIANIGAVHLYSAGGALISTIRGDRDGDHIGNGGIVVLEDGNFLILSASWHYSYGDVTSGAVTWVDASRGVSGVVSSANSLTGAGSVPTSNVFPLAGGDYAILMSGWTDDASASGKGAFLWATGGAPLTGPVSAANALVGSRPRDGESSLVVRLTNGNLVYQNQNWGIGDARFVGATTFFSRTSRPVGIASSSNSLVGSHDYDGSDLLVYALANGNYVVAGSSWTRGSMASAGAVTWGDGVNGTRGTISEQNSIVGRRANDSIGFAGGIEPLANGNYVISSPFWQDDAGHKAGASTWVDGRRAAVGEVTPANSLVGAGDLDGQGFAALALANGNYVVEDGTWSSGGHVWAGAFSWADGTRATTGVISAANAIVGTEDYESVGSYAVPLANGNYVIVADTYDESRGAVLWVDGRAPTSGEFSGEHAIKGATPGDHVGGVFALSDGNYVVDTPTWSDGSHFEVGAITWADGTRPTAETVSPANSVVGTHDSDRVGGCPDTYFCPHVTALAHGAYLVSSPVWDDGDAEDVGAVTWFAGHAAASGVVSAENSLTGAGAHEAFGYFWPSVFDDGMTIFQSFSVDLNVGVIAPRIPGNGLPGIVGLGADDVYGLTQYAYPGLTFDYDASRGMLIIGDPGSNFVTLRQLSVSESLGHSRHAKPAPPRRMERS